MLFIQMDILSYFMYFGVSLAMILAFLFIYIPLTPYDEISLIRRGQGASVISLSGTLIGYSLTLAACAIYNTSITQFIAWSVVAMIIQLMGYFLIVKIIKDVKQHIEKNNVAVGSLIGLVGIVLGIINAGCLS